MAELFDAVLSRRSLVKSGVAAGAVAAIPFSFELAAAQDKKVAWMITDTAGLGDQNFQDLANKGGMQGAADFGVEWKVTESVDQASFVPNLTAAADGGANLIVGVGYLLGDAITEVATQFPDTYFTFIDGVADPANVQSVVFKEQQIGYLTGIVSGKLTKSNKIGIVGGQRIPPVMRYEVGFVAGVKSVNPDAELIIVYTDSFDAADLGKQTAAAQFNQGADIIFPIAGATNTGVYLAVNELGKQPGEVWVIGVDTTQDHLAPGFEPCVGVKGVDFAVHQAIGQIASDTFQAGLLDLGLQEGGVSIVMYEGRVPADVAALTLGYQQAIIDGIIVPPVDDDTAAAFVVPPAPTPIEGTPQAPAPAASPAA
jgi:basic membrane protein A